MGEGELSEAIELTKPTVRQIVTWLALAACGSVMLLATTEQLCQEVTSVPLLWVLPLALYLLKEPLRHDVRCWTVSRSSRSTAAPRKPGAVRLPSVPRTRT